MAQDPAELFDLCDVSGHPTGAAKPRGLVHRDGDWHRAFHCWIVSVRSGRPELIMQRRAPEKDTWGGRWDVSVGGHYGSGEGLEGGIREIGEELGLHVTPTELVAAARRRDETYHPNGFIDREVEDVFFLRRDVEVTELHPYPLEVTAVASIPADVLSQIAAGDRTTGTMRGVELSPLGDWVRTTFSVTRQSFVPRMGQYYERAARFAVDLVRGRAAADHPVWW